MQRGVSRDLVAPDASTVPRGHGHLDKNDSKNTADDGHLDDTQAETSGLLIIIISELKFVVRFCSLAVELSALETNKGDPARARTRPSLKAI
ncbi:hypothetical protein ALC60_00793 [Trachymyrmex zeteki]|uniref:Uncharacterized protein n=1 Tax=Mycetomoellerius zeteki TaxID=64791 RepID=A0A151XJB1_9HYME|nr:hypothetical protein ALC60_00793 [Trachymyrmex zeteki]